MLVEAAAVLATKGQDKYDAKETAELLKLLALMGATPVSRAALIAGKDPYNT
jgi:hypothetical protein